MDFYWHICQALVTLPMMPDSLATPSLSSTFSLQEQLLKVSRFPSIEGLLLDSRGFFIWNSDAIEGVQTMMHCRQGDYLSALLSPTEDDNRRRRLDWDLALVSKEDYTHTNTHKHKSLLHWKFTDHSNFACECVNHKIALPGRKATNEHRAGRVGVGFMKGKAMKSITATRLWIKASLAT